jgi:peptidoglycan/LPS O-acetylase OafA/YrhL
MNRQFPALSGLAMVLIILHHTIELGTAAPERLGYPSPEGLVALLLRVMWALGLVAVPVFLFISGAFVAYAARGEPARLSGKFVRNSLSRIGWPYLLWSIVFYALVYVQSGERYSLLGYVKNLLVGYPFHFIPLLAFFYLLSPLLVRVGRSHGGLLLAGVGTYQIILINLVYPGALGFQFPSEMQFLAPPVLRTTMAMWVICFPMGLVYTLHAKQVWPLLWRFRWLVLAVTVLLFVIGVFRTAILPISQIARLTYPVIFLLLVPVIRRDRIPFVKPMERIGKGAYGLYLTHLIVLSLILLIIERVAPWLLNYYLLLLPVLFFLALEIPLLLMDGMSRTRFRTYFRYVFG